MEDYEDRATPADMAVCICFFVGFVAVIVCTVRFGAAGLAISTGGWALSGFIVGSLIDGGVIPDGDV